LLGLRHGTLDFIRNLILPPENLINGSMPKLDELAHRHFHAIPAVMASAKFRWDIGAIVVLAVPG